MDHGDCLSHETLTEYLEGGLAPPVKAVTEGHLLVCDTCRESLALYMRLLNTDVTPEESALIETIASQWQRPRTGGPSGGRTVRRFAWVLAVAAALVAGLLVAIPLLNRAEPASGEEVVQLLLAQRRPFEARISEQPYLPIVRTRGAEEPGVAYGLLGGEMSRLAAGNHEMGRFYLVQRDFDRAIPYLQKAEQEAGLPGTHNDLGAAYMEAGGADLLRLSSTEFQHALASDPAFAPAVFNMAIFYERTGASSEARQMLQRFLELDSTSLWASEARSKLEGFSSR